MKIIVSEWERARANMIAELTRDANESGVEGGDELGPSLPAGIAYPSSADPNVRRLAYALLGGLSSIEPWQAPEFKNSWTHYNAATHMPAAYMKDPFGFVHLRGLVKRTVAGFTSIVMFTLPDGYRPVLSSNFPVVGNSKFARLEIYSNGDVAIVAADSATPEGFVSLDGVTFDTRG